MNRCRMPFETLVDYQEGRADEATTERVRAHVTAGCASCQSRLAHLAHELTTLQEAERDNHVPETWVERARALYRERFRKPARTSWIAQLVFDSRMGALAPARGEESASFQLLYSAEEHDVDVWQEQRQAGSWYLIGQVRPREGGDALTPEAATLISAEGVSLTARLETEEFHVPDVPSGSYKLRIRLRDDEIVVPEVVVGA